MGTFQHRVARWSTTEAKMRGKCLVLHCLLLAILSTAFAEYHMPSLHERYPNLAKVRATVDPVVQQTAVRQLLQRLLPERYTEFELNVDSSLLDADGRDSFRIDIATTAPAKVQITGSTGVGTAWGLHTYLKDFCNSHISWSGDQLNLPVDLPLPNGPITISALDRFRYHENVCTPSYSSVWWSWERWQREIDWMALQGINMPLVIDGQEEIWYRVYTALGLTDDDLNLFFTGPAFFAWGRMGNIDAWGGPLPANFRHFHLNLTRQILTQMRNFGMTPALSAFSGHVPKTLQRIYPNANITQLGSWNGFAEPYCCTSVLDFNDPLFIEIGTMFINEQTIELGTDHVYSCDTFNEMTPPTDDPTYLKASGESVYKAMETADPDAVWLMQAWLFQSSFWQPLQAEALLTSVPLGRMLVLDLEADVEPFYNRFDSFYGQPYIWCMLHNFGGTLGLYGAVANISEGPPQARLYPNSTMIGTGFTMEGIEQNVVMYELMAEMGLRAVPLTNQTAWFQNYAKRRYGVLNGGIPQEIIANIDEAWAYLARSAYNCTTGLHFHGMYILTQRPKFGMNSIIWYNPSDVRSAWDHIVAAASANSSQLQNTVTFRHDLIDVTREALQLASIDLYQQMKLTYLQNDLAAFLLAGSQFLDLLLDMERVLATGEYYLLGTWLQSAKSIGTDDYEKHLYEFNARNQITTWGPRGEILDYATKQWSGVVSDYYWPRWNLFIKEVKSALETGVAFNQTEFNHLVFMLAEESFTYDRTEHPTTTTGNTVEVVRQIYGKWRPSLQNLYHAKKAYKQFISGKHFYSKRENQHISGRLEL